MKRVDILVIWLLVLVIGACSAPVRRGDWEQDRAPPDRVSAANIRDAVPRADPIRKSGNKSPYTVNGVTYQVMEDATGYNERGIASWYGQKFHGRKTSNGEIFDAFGVTAAHRSLPIPSYVRVTNLENQRQLVVRVNDRGPFHADRVIDLSYAAAKKLGFADLGTASVQLELIPVPGVKDLRTADAGPPWREVPVDSSRGRYLQVGAFGSREAAQILVAQLQVYTNESVAISEHGSGENSLFRVRVGPVSDVGPLLQLRNTLVEEGFETPRLLVE